MRLLAEDLLLLGGGLLGGLLCLLGCGLLGGLLGRLLGGGLLGGLLGLSYFLYFSQLEGARCAGSLDLGQFSVSNGLLQEFTNKWGQLGGVDLVGGGDVLLDGRKGASLTVLQSCDGSSYHGGNWWMSWLSCRLLSLGGLLGCSGGVRHVEFDVEYKETRE